jgi:hypothetical protein
VDRILQDCGAQPQQNFGIDGYNAEGEANYEWGQLVYRCDNSAAGLTVTGTLANVQAGDMVQFADATVPGSNGWTWTASHHTAIVVANLGNGNYQVVQQNIGSDPTVRSEVMGLGHLTQGTIWVYHPLSNS